MIKLNVKNVLIEKAERDAKPKPLPRVKVKSQSNLFEQAIAKISPEVIEEVNQQVKAIDDKARLLDELNADFVKVKKERAILSSQIWKLVGETEQRLRADTWSKADQFMDGSLVVPEIAEYAAKIEALTDQGAKIFDDIRYVELNGKLPATVEDVPSMAMTGDVKAINYEIRRLDDRIYKTRKKLETGKPTKNPARKAMWNEKIAFDEARRTDLKHKLKKLQYDARAERNSEGQE